MFMAIHGGCILNFDNPTICYLFAMFWRSIIITQHQSFFLACNMQYIVYIVSKRWYTPIATIFAMRPPFLMSDNIIFQIWILLHNFQYLVQRLPQLEPSIPSIHGDHVLCQWERIWALDHDISSLPNCRLCNLSLLSTFNNTVESHGSHL